MEDDKKTDINNIEDELDEDLFDEEDEDNIFDDEDDDDKEVTPKPAPAKSPKDSKDFIIERQKKKIERLQAKQGGTPAPADVSERLKRIEDAALLSTKTNQLTAALQHVSDDTSAEVERRVKRMMVSDQYANTPVSVLVSAVAFKLSQAKGKADDTAKEVRTVGGGTPPPVKAPTNGKHPDFSTMSRNEVSKYMKENRL